MTASLSLTRWLRHNPLRSFDEEDLLTLALEIEAEVCRRRQVDLTLDPVEPSDALDLECNAMYDAVLLPLPQSGSRVVGDTQTGQLRPVYLES